MGDQLFFSRETKVYVQPTNPTGVKISASAPYVGAASGNAKTNILLTNVSSRKVSIGDELLLGTVSLGRVTAVSGRGAASDATFTITGVADSVVTGGIGDSGATVTVSRPIFEIPVLDGYSFSQATNTTEVGISEMAGANNASRRGRKIFTDSFAPAEWSFTTYARPFKTTGGTFGANGVRSATADTQHAIEEVLWGLWAGEAQFADAASNAGAIFDSRSDVDGSAGVYSAQTSGSPAVAGQVINFTQSNKVTLGTANIFFALGDADSSDSDAALTVNGAVTAPDPATPGTEVTITIDKGPSGSGTDDYANKAAHGVQVGDIGVVVGGTAGKNDLRVTEVTSATQIKVKGLDETIPNNAKITFSRTLCYKIEECVVNEAGFEFDIDGIAQISWSGIGKIIKEVPAPTPTVKEGITSTTNLIRNRLTKLVISSTSPTTNNYSLVLTGGSITMSNNASFITPETLGLVNQPLSHITGARNVSGSFTCYLNTADNSSAELFETLLTNTGVITNNFDLTFKVGGEDTTLPRVEVAMTNVHLELPTHSIEDLISVETNFHALPSTIAGTDEATIKYIGV